MKYLYFFTAICFLFSSCSNEGPANKASENRQVRRLAFHDLSGMLEMDYAHVRDFLTNKGYDVAADGTATCSVKPNKTQGHVSLLLHFDKSSVSGLNYVSYFQTKTPEDPCYWSKDDYNDLIESIKAANYVRVTYSFDNTSISKKLVEQGNEHGLYQRVREENGQVEEIRSVSVSHNAKDELKLEFTIWKRK